MKDNVMTLPSPARTTVSGSQSVDLISSNRCRSRINDHEKSDEQPDQPAQNGPQVRELIRERQLPEEENTAKIEVLRAAIVAGEESGMSDLTMDQIWAKARMQHKPGNA